MIGLKKNPRYWNHGEKTADRVKFKYSYKKQCKLLGISNSGYYYEPVPEDPFNLHLMNLIDKQYTKTPFYGVEKMTAHLIRNGYSVNVKRIRRLYHIMDIEAIYPKRLSIPSLDYKYPYLLKNLIIDRPNFVWCADITYIKLLNGFACSVCNNGLVFKIRP